MRTVKKLTNKGIKRETANLRNIIKNHGLTEDYKYMCATRRCVNGVKGRCIFLEDSEMHIDALKSNHCPFSAYVIKNILLEKYEPKDYKNEW